MPGISSKFKNQTNANAKISCVLWKFIRIFKTPKNIGDGFKEENYFVFLNSVSTALKLQKQRMHAL